jgi:hypothetical protein
MACSVGCPTSGTGEGRRPFVKPGGFLYVTEIHPVAFVFDDENVGPGELRLRYPYWSHEQSIDVRSTVPMPT